MGTLSEILAEVYAILLCLSEEEKRKIPQEVWEEIEKRKSKTYKYSYNLGDEKNLADDTIAILCKIRLKYLTEK